MRRRKERAKVIGEINIAPLTDVILVLLIIFMVTTPLIYRSSIKIALPQVSSNQQPVETKDINVTINAAGEVFMQKQMYNLKLDKEIFRFKLQTLAKGYKDPAIVISGDKNVKYDYVVQVIDIASKLGIKRLVLATEFKR